MAGETLITVIGNLTADPELRSTQSGTQVAGFTIASTPRTFDRQANEWKDGEALFLRANAWRELANNVAATLTKGMRVIAQGHLKQKSYKDREGNDRTSIELEVVEIGPALTFATAQVTRAGRGGVQQGGQQPNQPTQGYGPPQGSYGPPQTQQQPQQGYPAPAQQPQQAQQPIQQSMQQPQQGYPVPQQAVQQPQQAPVQQQAPPQPQAQPGTQQGAQQGNWGGQPAWGADETPF